MLYSPIVLVKNKKTYNKKRKKAPEYQVGDLIAVQRTQFGEGLKLRPKFFGPYQITEVKPRNRYTVEKERKRLRRRPRERRERKRLRFYRRKVTFFGQRGGQQA
ncbi:hypothetical protein TNCV_3306741 [Trichonephila clavipes]|nr:hypothetical protein TNCV_3306741 [Trichonephila clavipes]